MVGLVVYAGLPEANRPTSSGFAATKSQREHQQRFPRIFSSTSLRFTAIYLLVFGFSSVLLAASLWYSTVGLLNRQVESAVLTEAQFLAGRFNESGLTDLVTVIQGRLGDNFDDHALYLLVDSRGDRIVGNLDQWPSAVEEPQTWYQLPIKRYEIGMQATFRFYKLPGGYRLLVGRDTRTIANLRGVLFKALLAAFGAMIILGFFGGVVVRTLFRRALGSLSDITDAINRGDMTRRVPLKGSNDEIDQLAWTINGILERVEKLMDGVRQATNSVAHDLRTPITRARSRFEAAALAEKDPDKLKVIDQSIEDLDGIIRIFNSVLRISEIEVGSQRSEFKKVNISQIIKDVVEFYECLGQDRNVKLVGRCSESLFAVADQHMLHQAVANLVDNAMKFTPDDSIVTLTGRSKQTGVETLGMDVEISVCDEGIGIPEADREKVIERFYRAEAARNTPGSGLGLTLVAAVAELHCGKLRFDDNTPGLKATLSLPSGIRQANQSKASLHREQKPLSRGSNRSQAYSTC